MTAPGPKENGVRLVRLLKQDELGRVELLDGPQGLVVRRVACGGRMPGSRLLAHGLARRERAALARLDGLAGVAWLPEAPEYAGAPGHSGRRPKTADVLLRSWLPGMPLYSATALPSDFFDRLEELVCALHARGVCHNDLHKEPNILVGPDGRPCLVDFQLASLHRRRGRSFKTRVREDLRHVEKHRHRYLTRCGRDRSGAPGKHRAPLAALWMHTGKRVYNLVTRRLLRRKPGEPRRPREGPWPEWDPPIGREPDCQSGRPG